MPSMLYFLIVSIRAVGSSTSPGTTFTCAATSAMAARLGVLSSRTKSFSPDRSKWRVRWRPRKPVPPVIKIAIVVPPFSFLLTISGPISPHRSAARSEGNEEEDGPEDEHQDFHGFERGQAP